MPPRTCKCELIWEKGLFRYNYINSLETISSWIMVGLKSNDKCLYRKKEEEKTHRGEGWYEDSQRHWSNASRSQRVPRIGCGPQKLGWKHTLGSPSEPPEGTKLADTLTLDFWLPELWENMFLLFCDNLLQQLRILIQKSWLQVDSKSPPSFCSELVLPAVQLLQKQARFLQAGPLPGNICLSILNIRGNVQETIIVLQFNSLEFRLLEKITSVYLKIPFNCWACLGIHPCTGLKLSFGYYQNSTVPLIVLGSTLLPSSNYKQLLIISFGNPKYIPIFKTLAHWDWKKYKLPFLGLMWIRVLF